MSATEMINDYIIATDLTKRPFTLTADSAAKFILAMP